MRKILPVFIAFIFVFSTFIIQASAVTESFDMTIPDYYEKISDSEWYTDEFMINDSPTEVTLTVEFYDAENSPSFLTFSLGYFTYHDEIIGREDFKEFIEGTKSTITTTEDYEGFCASYISVVDETEKAVCCYSFYSENQTCTFTFVADDIQFALSGEAENIINTVTFEEDFFKTEDIVETLPQRYPLPEMPTVPVIDFYTGITTSIPYENATYNGDTSWSISQKVTAVAIGVFIVLIVAIVAKKKSASKKASFRTYMTITENQPKEKRICLLREGDQSEGSSWEIMFEDSEKVFITKKDWASAKSEVTSCEEQIIDELEVVYFKKNTVEDFITFLSERYKKDFSHIRSRKDIKSLFKRENRPSGPIEVKETIVKQTEPAKGASFSFEKNAFIVEIVKAEGREFVRITNYSCYAGANARDQYELDEKYYDLSQVDSDGISADNYREKIKGEPVYHHRESDWGCLM